MITKLWINKRRPGWEQLAALVDRADRKGLPSLRPVELRTLALLYREAAGDLSRVREDRSARTLAAELNALVSRAHGLMYAQARRGGLRAVLQFFGSEYPALFRRLLPYVLFSLTLLVCGALSGALLAAARPQFALHLLGPRMISTIEAHRMWTERINAVAPAASSGIMTNNLSVTFLAFAAQLTAGLGTLYMIAWNGILLGVIAMVCREHGMSLQLWSFVAPHGSLELPAIVIGGAAGFRLASGLLFPGVWSRRHSLALAGAEATRLIAGVVPLLVVAGLFEGFFSPTHAPAALKVLVGAVLFSLLNLWLLRPPTAAMPQASDRSLISR